MIFDTEMIYSKRYPPPMEELEQLPADAALPDISEARTEASYQNFRRRIRGGAHYGPIPGREEKAGEFIALAKEFSEEHEIDIDIRRTPHSVEASLHLYCAAYPKAMTRQFARLFDMCDNLASFLPKTEPSGFTLVLSLDTHKFYLDGMLMDY